MRLALLVAVVSLAVAGSAAAQEPPSTGGSGRVGIDVVAAPAFGSGVGGSNTVSLALGATFGL